MEPRIPGTKPMFLWERKGRLWDRCCGSQNAVRLDASRNHKELRTGAPILVCTLMPLETKRTWEWESLDPMLSLGNGRLGFCLSLSKCQEYGEASTRGFGMTV